MSVLRAPKAGLDPTFGLIAKRLRGESEEAAREPLPECWVELIHHLDEQERMASDRQGQAEAKPRRVSPL